MTRTVSPDELGIASGASIQDASAQIETGNTRRLLTVISGFGISAEYQEGLVKNVMMHDGSWVKFRKLAKDYDPTNRDAAYVHIREHQRKGEVVTGLLYISPDSKDVHDQNETVPGALYNLPHAQLCRGNDTLQKLMRQFR